MMLYDLKFHTTDYYFLTERMIVVCKNDYNHNYRGEKPTQYQTCCFVVCRFKYLSSLKSGGVWFAAKVFIIHKLEKIILKQWYCFTVVFLL